METVILRKDALKKIRQFSKTKYENEEKEVIGFLIGFFREEEIEITDIIIPEQTGDRTYVEVEEEVSLVNALIKSNKKGTNEVCVGYFHSHPGYRAFLSAIDIETQVYWQKVNPRNIALVYDPIHSEVKAFRVEEVEDAFREITVSIKIEN
ncbi:MAG: Mov34/MPN/PAD-1 family protein [Candidatus Helarchaeota archaeon]|nr:Mov34/MPN/PAD-1 family protein [Candidatus Helarchaeota archaeon]